MNPSNLLFKYALGEHYTEVTGHLCLCSFSSVIAGTTERVCLIQGTVEALNGVHNFIAEKVREMPQSAQKPEPVSILQPQTTVNPDRVKQVRYCTVSRLRVCVWSLCGRNSSLPGQLVYSLICCLGHDLQSDRVRKMLGYVVIFTYSLS